MSNKRSKVAAILAILFEIIVLITGIIEFFKDPKKIMFLSLLAMLCLTLPFIVTYIANKRNMLLPPHFQLFFLIFIFSAQYLGEIIGFYEKFLWWDTLLHFISGIYLTVIGIYLIKEVFMPRNETVLKRFILFSFFFSFSFTVTIGVLWEIFEFVGDYLFKTHMVNGDYEDSAIDLLVKTIGALIASLIYHQKNK